MANELVRQNTGAAVAIAPTLVSLDPERVMRALKLDPKDPNTQALVLVCQRYSLDPLLKHPVLIQGSLYVTRDGLLHVAHASGDFDGLEVEVLADSQTHYIALCRVYRKSMSRPFTYQGRYPKNGRMAAQYGPEMAEKVAECRALRRAFDVSLCSREELWEEPSAETMGPRPKDAEIVLPALPVPNPAAQREAQTAARSTFDSLMNTLLECGPLTGVERGQLANVALGRLADSRDRIDWLEALESLDGDNRDAPIVKGLKAVLLKLRGVPAPATAAQTDEEDPSEPRGEKLFGDDDLADPFADDKPTSAQAAGF